jgi:hypothetical protein
MVALNEQERQALDFLLNLPPERQRMILYELARKADEGWRSNNPNTEQRFRDLAVQYGKNWDLMNEDDRLDFVCEIQHEDH